MPQRRRAANTLPSPLGPTPLRKGDLGKLHRQAIDGWAAWKARHGVTVTVFRKRPKQPKPDAK